MQKRPMDVLLKSFQGALRQTRLSSRTPETFLKALPRFLHNSNSLHNSPHTILRHFRQMANPAQHAIRTIFITLGAFRKSAERQIAEKLRQQNNSRRYIPPEILRTLHRIKRQLSSPPP